MGSSCGTLDEVDRRTLNYLELISAKKGADAIAAWLRWTGWRDHNDLRPKQRAAIVKAMQLKQGDKYSPRYQISVERRLRQAYRLARKHIELGNT